MKTKDQRLAAATGLPLRTRPGNPHRHLVRAGSLLIAIFLLALTALVVLPPVSTRASAAAPDWNITGSMTMARGGHTATALAGPACEQASGPDYCGKVLVAGGCGANCSAAGLPFLAEGYRDPATSRSAELYDPWTGTWSRTGDMNDEHVDGGAVQLLDGRVLAVGTIGLDYSPNSSELYDPTLGTWKLTSTPPIKSMLWGFTLTLIAGSNCGVNCGKVLLVGGEMGNTAISQLFDPKTESWTLAAPPLNLRTFHTASLVSGSDCEPDCGKVLVVGGHPPGAPLNACTSGPSGRSAELFDPSVPGGLWTPTRQPPPYFDSHGALSLNNGKVLLGGGYSGGCTPPHLYEPSDGSWTQLNTTGAARTAFPAILLQNGKVLSRPDNAGDLYLYDPDVEPEGTWTQIGPMNYWGHPFALLPCESRHGRVLSEGRSPFGPTETAEAFDGVPTLTKIEPAQAIIGTQTRLTLSGLGFSTAVVKVRFGGVEKDPESVSADGTSLEVTVPPSDQPVSLPIVVTVDGEPADTCDKEFLFTYVSPDASIPAVSIADVSVLEGNTGTTAAKFAVSLSAPTSNRIDLEYSMSDGSATNSSDYRLDSGTVTYAPRATTQTIQTQVVGDTEIEPNETFTLTLRLAAAAATLARATATGTIIDDDTVIQQAPPQDQNEAAASLNNSTGTDVSPAQPVQQAAAQQAQAQAQQQAQAQGAQAQQVQQAQAPVQQVAQSQVQQQAQAQAVAAQVQPAGALQKHREVQIQAEKLGRDLSSNNLLATGLRRAPFTAVVAAIAMALASMLLPKRAPHRAAFSRLSLADRSRGLQNNAGRGKRGPRRR